MGETKICKWCRSEIDARAKFCPKCGQVVRGARTLTVILLIFLALAVLVAIRAIVMMLG